MDPQDPRVQQFLHALMTMGLKLGQFGQQQSQPSMINSPPPAQVPPGWPAGSPVMMAAGEPLAKTWRDLSPNTYTPTSGAPSQRLPQPKPLPVAPGKTAFVNMPDVPSPPVAPPSPWPPHPLAPPRY